MRTRLILVLFIATTLSTFAQKRELRAVSKALKSGEYAEAKTLLGPAEAMMGAMDEEEKATYYLYKARALFQDGGVTSSNDMLEAAKAIKMAKDIDANNPEVNTLADSIRTAVVNSAVEDQNQKKYEIAAAKLEAMYRVNPVDTAFLYFAASNLVTANVYDKAVAYYKELQDLGYTGITQKYVATDAETGEVKDDFASKEERDLFVKGGAYINPKTVQSESRTGEITKNIALIYVSQGKNDEALAAMKEARALYPDDMDLLMTEANVQYKMGNTEGFKELMKEALAMDPDNPETLYNLGVATNTTGDKEGAKEYYIKALEIDPMYTNANLNLASLIMSEEAAIVDEMNNLGTSSADNRRYDELKEKRQNLYEEAVPYFEAANEAKENVEVVRTLMNIYSILGETEKFKAKKARLEELGG